MLTCRIKPDYNTCFGCIDYQIKDQTEKDCKTCDLTVGRCDILKLGVSFFGKPYALILAGDRIKKVALDRIYDVKEKSWIERNFAYENENI